MAGHSCGCLARWLVFFHKQRHSHKNSNNADMPLCRLKGTSGKGLILKQILGQSDVLKAGVFADASFASGRGASSGMEGIAVKAGASF